jgi:hypothetical protein
MRCVVGFVLALALMASPRNVRAQEHEEAPQSAALGIHGKSHAPLQLMLRTTYFYDIGVDPLSGAPTTAAPTEVSRQGGMTRGGKIAMGVLIPVLVVGIGVGIGATVSIRNMDLGWE